MKKYKNISGYPLPIDCITHTRYISPGEIASLPLSRDVRHYSMLRKLAVVNERREKTFIKKVPPIFKKPILKVVEKEDKVINLKKNGDK
jgi:hypothetical protein